MKDLKEIKDYWDKKYPHVTVTLWCNQKQTKYFGLMSGIKTHADFSADTVGELIAQGESFLRRLNTGHCNGNNAQ